MNASYSSYSDEYVLQLIGENDDEQAFAELYSRYFNPLFNYAFNKVDDRFSAQEIVQELFVSIWQRRKHTVQFCRAYLFSSIKRMVISHYRREFIRKGHQSQWEIQRQDYPELADGQVLVADLEQRYQKGLYLLSPKCKEVFLLSREGFSNRMISEQLAISEKTVESHMTKALRILKDYLKEHLAYAILLILLFQK